MIPGEIKGYRTVLDDCGEHLFFNPKYLIDKKYLYGLSKEAQIWEQVPDVGIINLYFSSTRGCFRGGDFNLALSDALEKAEKDCARGKEPTIPSKFKPFLKAVKNPDGSFSVVCDYEAWRKKLKDKGFFSMLSSRDFGAGKTYNLYALRMVSEVQYRILKSQEGFDTARVHTDEALMSKFAICFAATVLRHAIMTACQNRCLDTNEMIQKMDRITLLLLENRNYRFIRDMSVKARELFEEFSMNMDSFDVIARDYTKRKTEPINSQVHKLPETGKIQKRKRGRQPGSKNKATLAREAAIAEAKARGDYVEDPKRKKGRPFGSKDSKPRKLRSDSGVKRGPRKNK